MLRKDGLMKTTLKIETDHPEICEMDQIKIYAHAMDMYLAITNAMNAVRNRLKHGEEVTPQESIFLMQLQEELYIESPIQ